MSKKLNLISSDGKVFEIDEAMGMQSQTIKHVIEDNCTENGIPLPNVKSNIMPKLVEYLTKHAEANDSNREIMELKKWDSEFIAAEPWMLFEIILASNYLAIDSLYDLSCQAAADMIKGKSAEEIRKIFNVENDFSPEEEEQIRKENQWRTSMWSLNDL